MKWQLLVKGNLGEWMQVPLINGNGDITPLAVEIVDVLEMRVGAKEALGEAWGAVAADRAGVIGKLRMENSALRDTIEAYKNGLIASMEEELAR